MATGRGDCGPQYSGVGGQSRSREGTRPLKCVAGVIWGGPPELLLEGKGPWLEEGVGGGGAARGMERSQGTLGAGGELPQAGRGPPRPSGAGDS